MRTPQLTMGPRLAARARAPHLPSSQPSSSAETSRMPDACDSMSSRNCSSSAAKRLTLSMAWNKHRSERHAVAKWACVSKFHRQAYHGGDETELAATATRAPRRLIARAVLPLLRFRPAIPFVADPLCRRLWRPY